MDTKKGKNRFFVNQESLQGEDVLLVGQQAHQIRNVLRIGTGEHIIVPDNRGSEFEVSLTAIGRGQVKGKVIEKRRAMGEPDVIVTLYQSLLSRDKFEWVLQKCTEVGVARFVPLVTGRSVVREKTNKPVRWRRIITEAAEQSHRGLIPELSAAIDLKEAVGGLDGFDCALIASPHSEGVSLRTCLDGCGSGSGCSNIALFIGPEGGFTEQEVHQLCGRGASAFSLGKRILRTETAAVVACALILYELDRMEA